MNRLQQIAYKNPLARADQARAGKYFERRPNGVIVGLTVNK